LSQADIGSPIEDDSNVNEDKDLAAAKAKANRLRYARAAMALAIAIMISAAVFVIGNRIERFERYGYPGIFLLNLLSSATIVVPAPGLAVVSIMGSVLNPWLVGLCAGTGDALGELTGYLAGYSGRAVIEDQARYEQMARWTQRYGLWVILVLSIIPNPLFDLAGIAAGALKVPLARFLLICWIGKTIKTTLFALGGQSLLRLLPFAAR
jgi:membrane protein YqaA with SNARE-associated domain